MASMNVPTSGWSPGSSPQQRVSMPRRRQTALAAAFRFLRPPSRAYEYRQRAQECLELVRTFGDRDARATLSHVAQAWLRLADIAAPEQKRPVQQQQQQTQPEGD